MTLWNLILNLPQNLKHLFAKVLPSRPEWNGVIWLRVEIFLHSFKYFKPLWKKASIFLCLFSSTFSEKKFAEWKFSEMQKLFLSFSLKLGQCVFLFQTFTLQILKEKFLNCRWDHKLINRLIGGDANKVLSLIPSRMPWEAKNKASPFLINMFSNLRVIVVKS